jgi:alpha-mannosidase
LEGRPYPLKALTEAWHKLAFHQFHDILPGTSIPEVYEDAHKKYDEIRRLAAGVISDSSGVFVDATAEGYISVYNPLPYSRSALVAFADSEASAVEDTVTGQVYPVHSSEQDSSFYAKELPPCSFRTFKITDKKAHASQHPDEFVLSNDFLTVTIDPETGWISSVIDLRCEREVLSSPGGNILTLWKEDSFENQSAEEWNAWDIGPSANSERATLSRRLSGSSQSMVILL